MNSSRRSSLQIIIVNYKSSDYLAKCLDSIPFDLQELEVSVTVVDNNSKEEKQLHQLRKIHPKVDLLFNRQNLGFSTACNQGISRSDSELCLLLNPDTEINDSALLLCARLLRDRPEAGIAGCRILNSDGTEQRASRRNIPSPASALLHFTGLRALSGKLKGIKPYHPAVAVGDSPLEVEAVSGSFLMFKRRLGESIGFLDESFFMYGEDLDFCYRSMLAGWKTFYLPQAAIIHHKRISSSRSAMSANVHFYRAMEIFYRKHYYPSAGRISRSAVLTGIRTIQFFSQLKLRLTGNHAVGSKG